MMLLSLDGATALAQGVAKHLAEPLAPVEHRPFEDGEHKWRPLSDPRGRDVFVISALHGDDDNSPQDKLVRLLLMLSTLRDHGAHRVTPVLPYLAYARKDARTQPFDPLATQAVARWMEASGAGQMLVLEAHNPAALANAFRCPLVMLDAWRAFDEAADAMVVNGRPVVVAAPDPGGVKRALRWREHLQDRWKQTVGFAMVDKRRVGSLVTGGQLVAGDVQGAAVLLLDDIVASGGTLAHAADALHHAGAAVVQGFAAHGLFVGDADRVLSASHLAGLVVTDSVPAFRLPPSTAFAPRLKVVTAARLLARAIGELHQMGR
jgi:ribose-phosphate pyrophosphokinase